jgi:hypothetical protein
VKSSTGPSRVGRARGIDLPPPRRWQREDVIATFAPLRDDWEALERLSPMDPHRL